MTDRFTYVQFTPVEVTSRYKTPRVGGNRVEIDARSHMLGAGRYVTPGLFNGVQALATSSAIINSGQSYISYNDLINVYNFSADDFIVVVNQRTIDVTSADYATRAYVYGTESY